MSAKEPELPTHDDHHHGHDHDHDHGEAETLAAPGPTSTFGYWRSLRELDGQAPFQTDPTP